MGISALGLGSGLDLSGILESLRSADEAPIRLMQTRQQEYSQRAFELDALASKYLTMKTAAEELSSVDAFGALTASSSDESVLTVSTTSSAVAGTYDMAVTRLATQDSWVSSGVATADTVVSTAGGAFTYDYDGAAGGSVTLAAGATLQDLADGINDDVANPGVTAMVLDTGDGTGNPFVLQIISNETGEANSITAVDVSALDSTTFAETEPAVNRDAALTVGGVDFIRASNTITDLYDGMTLNLEAVGGSTVKVEVDTATIKEKIIALIDAQNSAQAEITAMSAYDEDTQVSGPLNGLSSVTSLPMNLGSIMTSTLSGLGGAYENLVDIGLEVDKYGTYSFDETVLDEALSSNLDDVKLLFAGDDGAVDGVADLLDDELDTVTSSSALGGLLSTEEDAAQGAADRLDESIAEASERLDKRYETLARQFVMLDQLMSSLRNEGDFLASTFSGLSKAWG